MRIICNASKLQTECKPVVLLGVKQLCRYLSHGNDEISDAQNLLREAKNKNLAVRLCHFSRAISNSSGVTLNATPS